MAKTGRLKNHCMRHHCGLCIVAEFTKYHTGYHAAVTALTAFASLSKSTHNRLRTHISFGAISTTDAFTGITVVTRLNPSSF